MEEIWKKHKDEIKEHLLKIENFLKSELKDTSKTNETFEIIEKPPEISHDIQQIQSIVLDENIKFSDESRIRKKRGRPRSKRKEVYGKLKDIVKSLMEKENISRAQAYRKAKKIYEKTK
jgi:hypothetical protein